MTADLVNLRHARKAKERAEHEQNAAERRRAFGRTKTEKKKEAAERERDARAVDGHRREP